VALVTGLSLLALLLQVEVALGLGA